MCQFNKVNFHKNIKKWTIFPKKLANELISIVPKEWLEEADTFQTNFFLQMIKC